MPRRGATSKVRCCCFSARSTYSLWRTIWSQKRRVTMAQAQNRKNPHISQKRASFMGVARGAVLRGRLARSVACMRKDGSGFRLDHRDSRLTDELLLFTEEVPREYRGRLTTVVRGTKEHASGAKAPRILLVHTARLKSCPFKQKIFRRAQLTGLAGGVTWARTGALVSGLASPCTT